MGGDPLFTVGVIVMEGMRLTLRAPVLATALVDCCCFFAASCPLPHHPLVTFQKSKEESSEVLPHLGMMRLMLCRLV